MRRILSAVVGMLFVTAACYEMSAEVSMSPLFTDNMVLQQKTDAPVWGTATPGSQVEVMTSWNKRVYKAKADEAGKWMVKVATPKAGGPYTVGVREHGGETRTIENVLIGEVWLCSGQSNMEMPVKGWGKVYDFEKELKNAAKYPKVRFLEVQKALSPVPGDDFVADYDGWVECSPETLEEFSAVAYFFGRTIHLEENVPVGLINTSWGGTYIEPWMSAEALQDYPEFANELANVASWSLDKEERKRAAADDVWTRLYNAFNEYYFEQEKGFPSACYDDSDWDEIRLPGLLETVYPGLDGHILVRKEFVLPQEWVGKPLKMYISAVDDNDKTYFNGTLIGEGEGWQVERNYDIPAELVTDSKVMIAMRIVDTRDTGGLDVDDDSFYLVGPDGQKFSLVGTWKIRKHADFAVLPTKPANMKEERHCCTVLYNAMIRPLVPYAIKGAIWYQGCSNVDRAYRYRDLMTGLIDGWRKDWGYEFPFYITQLANYLQYQTQPEESIWAELRESQDVASRVTANAGMAVTIDIGDAEDIHPKNKQEVGRRLALQALNKTYGKSVVCSGPLYEGYEVDGNVIRIRFSSVGKGLVAKGGKLEGFTIAGADRQFHWAEARIVGDCVEVTCKDVERPLAVRYAWANNPVISLFNSEGLPAGPFRTDSWPPLTLYNTSFTL